MRNTPPSVRGVRSAFLQRVTRSRPLQLGLRARHRDVSPSQPRPSHGSSGRLLLAQALRNSAAAGIWLSHWTSCRSVGGRARRATRVFSSSSEEGTRSAAAAATPRAG
jgi:hypothetical protein